MDCIVEGDRDGSRTLYFVLADVDVRRRLDDGACEVEHHLEDCLPCFAGRVIVLFVLLTNKKSLSHIASHAEAVPLYDFQKQHLQYCSYLNCPRTRNPNQHHPTWLSSSASSTSSASSSWRMRKPTHPKTSTQPKLTPLPASTAPTNTPSSPQPHLHLLSACLPSPSPNSTSQSTSHWKPSSPSFSSASESCSRAPISNPSNGARGPATWSAAKRLGFLWKLVLRPETLMRSWRTGLGFGIPEVRGRLLECGLRMARRLEVLELQCWSTSGFIIHRGFNNVEL